MTTVGQAKPKFTLWIPEVRLQNCKQLRDCSSSARLDRTRPDQNGPDGLLEEKRIPSNRCVKSPSFFFFFLPTSTQHLKLDRWF